MRSETQLFEAVRRGGNRAPGSWIAVVSATEPDESLINEIRSEAEAQFRLQFRVIDLRAIEPFQLARELSRFYDDWVLLYGFDHWPPQRWHAAELNRNSWLREGGSTWFLLGPTAVSNIGLYAPNVRSLIGPYLVISPDDTQMTEAECHSRLAQLRDHYGKTDVQIVAEAQSQTLEMTPHMVEWLVLMDRGDLV